ncbi:hypothetical protein [Actinocrispum wychmicini]|uniref:Uncharacterized protein n=1 Tax=Actinocrispum wychmicini TaxID=1213861 RepID=A0A4R2JRP9_9PSEU|nr:hypothetical protein [Actinocrispum wychmicini]TCO62931.1 hypothetical protein EV192_1021071 [Actinocrispum wychmicini]
MAEGAAPSSSSGTTPAPIGSTPRPPDPHKIDEINAEAAQARATAQANNPYDPGSDGVDSNRVVVRRQRAEAATQAATGAGFQFTPKEVEHQLTHCHEQIADLTADLRSAQRAKDIVREPAPDDASVALANAVRDMFSSTIDVVNADIAYVTDWQSKLVMAKNQYMANEHLTEQQWQRLAQGLPE